MPTRKARALDAEAGGMSDAAEVDTRQMLLVDLQDFALR
jgi:hypothetical protein